MDPIDCTIIGDVFIDIVVQVNGSQGNFFREGTSYCKSADAVTGGSGNVAAGLSALGGTAAFVGKAGCDFFGRLYKKNLEEQGIITEIFLDKHLPSGLVIVFVEDKKQRSFLVSRGANDRLSSDEIEKATSLIERSNYIYFSGYSLVNNPQRNAILKSVDLAKKSKAKIVFDPGAFNLVRSEKNLFAQMAGLCDVFSPNLEEARALTDIPDIDGVVSKLRERIPLTTLKCGDKGCILISRKNVVTVRAYNVECMDPTGAGDAFTAGVIYGLSRGLPLESAGRLANWFAAEVVTGIGPRSFPEKSKIERFLERLLGPAHNKETTI